MKPQVADFCRSLPLLPKDRILELSSYYRSKWRTIPYTSFMYFT